MRERAVRVQIRLPAGLHRSLEECAERSGLSTAGLVRLFLEEGLAGAPTTAVEALKSRRGAGDLVSLSTLVASEHLLKLIELITPGAIRVTRDARAQAFGAARQRLDEVRAQVEDEV